MADRREDVLELAALGRRVVDVVRDDDREAELFGQSGGLGHQPVVVGQEVVLELEDEAGCRDPRRPPHARAAGATRATGRAEAARTAGRLAPRARAEQPGVALGDRPCPLAVADPEASGDLPVAAARQRHEPLGVLGEERLAEPRHALRPGQVRPADQAAQAAIADPVAGEQDEMRATLARADARADPP